ncbi:PAS domain-containing serine/threonine-protein kinase isoform X2 [Phlebotomus papatasi]|nr:PAS domain-containing serine/threonine-protein kinase isoform X2 [Phlebotomus papatasi]XP_055702493.1 PAS domain-containing serine/threonine-protein kinase isoform X2 [Phlebotomus papatasi]
MEKIRVDGANGVRFTARRAKGCFTPGSTGSPFTSGSLVASAASESLMRIPKSEINPNKAVFTIDSKTSQILIVNNNACLLLGFSSRELCEMQFGSLLANKNKQHVSALAEGQLNSEDGTMVLLSGKVVEMNTKAGNPIAVSLWIRQIDSEGRCLAVAEPVERRVAELVIDRSGFVVSGDYDALLLFQLDSADQFKGMDVTSLIPAIHLPDPDNPGPIPKHVRKQKATGRTFDGISFPLCLMITRQEPGEEDDASAPLYIVTIWVFTNLSGLVVIEESGIIESCNHHFSMLMFGYAQGKILGQHITKIVPNFGQELEYVGYNRSRNATISSLGNEESETETDPVYVERTDTMSNSADAGKVCLDFTSSKVSCSAISELSDDMSNLKSLSSDTRSDMEASNVAAMAKSVSDHVLAAENYENNKNVANTVNNLINSECMGFTKELNCAPVAAPADSDLLTPVNETDRSYLSATSQPEELNNLSQGAKKPQPPNSRNVMEVRRSSATRRSQPPFTDGKYKGEAIHCDGNIIDILYTISSQTLPCGGKVYCVWICRDPDTDYELNDEEERHQNLTLTFNSVTSTVENSLGQAIKVTAAQNTSRPNSMSLVSQCEEEQISGEFNKHYTTLKQIGKGAYGYVKMAYRNSDRLLVIAKFILKEKLCPQFMVMTEEKREVPMEVYLLTTVKHPNIVQVLDVFENDKFFQLVMEKHGSGMDLFEFIDRLPMMDEKLGCYIFRQIAAAVDYLHSLKILHRDIKDENIIIDHNFHVKLIDFGSATFMEDGKLFSTFFGTTEYCSPEVLAGNKYAGPELEMWSLGVTLYVIMFFENPFVDVEETLHADLVMPHKVSAGLEALLITMLDKNPKTRCTMKQLMTDPWLTQEINTTMFNFSWIVPCEPHEENPEKYYTGQIYSSTTALSTTSPHDSLSLADDDSMIDAEGDDEDDDADEEDETSLPSQNEQGFMRAKASGGTREKTEGAEMASAGEADLGMDESGRRVAEVPASEGNGLMGRALGAPVDASVLMCVNSCCEGDQARLAFVHSHPFAEDKYAIRHVAHRKKMHRGKRQGVPKHFRHSYRGDLDGNCSYSDVSITPADEDVMSKSVTELEMDAVTVDPRKEISTEALPSTKAMFMLKSEALALSKSENNIFEKQVGGVSIFDVVSMSDLNEPSGGAFPSYMNDLSKTQILNQISNEELVRTATVATGAVRYNPENLTESLTSD